jgi:hypothetical protein
MFDNEFSEAEGPLKSLGMDGNTKGGKKPPNFSIRNTDAQQQDIGVELESRGENGKETS